MVPYPPDSHNRPKAQNAAQLLADREPLLRCQDHSGVLTAGVDPLRVQPIEIGDIKRIKDTSSGDKIVVHGFLIEVDLDLAH